MKKGYSCLLSWHFRFFSTTNVFAQSEQYNNQSTISVQTVKKEMNEKGIEFPEILEGLEQIEKEQIKYTSIPLLSTSGDNQINWATCASFTNMLDGGSHILAAGGTECNVSILQLTISQNLQKNGSIMDSNFSASPYSRRVDTGTSTKHIRWQNYRAESTHYMTNGYDHKYSYTHDNWV